MQKDWCRFTAIKALPISKKTLIKSISDQTQVPLAKVAQIVQSVLDGIIDVLATEGRIELRNFGIFQVQKRKARIARNPRTGEAVAVPERLVVRFKSGLEMAARVGKVFAG